MSEETDRLRERARRCRALAKQVYSEEMRRNLLDLAAALEERADKIAEGA
jgi:hypothetical protein